MVTYNGKWPDYKDGYAAGYAEAESLRLYANRLAAFGAIRRAAKVARRIERDTTWDDVDDGLGDLITAAGIREAIRAAIASEKN